MSVEKAVAFGPSRSLVGVLTTPTGGLGDPSRPIALILNSGIVHHAGIWRLHVRVARALARAGFSSLRFDLSGLGDSADVADATPLDHVVRRDIDQAIDYVRSATGAESVTVMGLCSGASDAIATAERRDEVVGVVAIDLIADFRTWQFQAVHFGRRLFRMRSWVQTLTGRNRRLREILERLVGGAGNWARDPIDDAEGLLDLGIRPWMGRNRLQELCSALIEREVHLFLAFSGGLEDNYNHRNQLAEALPGIAAHAQVTTDYFPAAQHTFDDVEEQRALIESVVTWHRASFESVPRSM